MVFFTCNHCGASVKKNKVEKHYGTECKNFPSLSCMDCQKDFQGSEFEKHTKCITEDEKYSAKGFVPKPSSNKGEIKQQSWLEVVKSVRDSEQRFSQIEKSILDTIVDHENVPRKKTKFMNFLKSTFNKRYDPTAADNIWRILEEKYESSKTQVNGSGENSSETAPNSSNVDSAATETFDESAAMVQSTELISEDVPAKKKKKDKKNKNQVTSSGENGSEMAPNSNNVDSAAAETFDESAAMDQSTELISKDVPAKKKKKGKKGKNQVNGSEITLNSNVDSAKTEMFDESAAMDQSTEEDVSTKKKKKAKKNSESEKENSLQNNSEEVANDPPAAVENGNALTKKERKEKRKREKYEATLKEIEHQQFGEIDTVSEDSPKKKRKKSKKDGSEIEAVVEQYVADPNPSKKKSKKRIKEATAEELKEGENHQNGVEDNAASSQENGDQKFNWSKKIIELIQTKGGEMPLKRLRKKIVVEYQNCTDSNEDQEIVTVKFNKKLMKVPGISINKEIVQLVN